MKTTDKTRLRRLVGWIDARLVKAYGEPAPHPPGDPLDGLIATILSQNTSDTNSKRAYAAMRAAFPTWKDVMNASPKQLENILRPGGLAKTKGARIQRLLESITAKGRLSLDPIKKMTNDEAQAYLLAFDGVGYKTARCVLLFQLGRDVFPIDTHVYRVLRRMDIIPEKMNGERAHLYLPQFIAKGRCYPLHINLIRHGRHICHPRNPECAQCPLQSRCGFWKTVESAQ
ncbi:MAG: endonuclease III [Candidatus Hydrogenedentota bacterium]